MIITADPYTPPVTVIAYHKGANESVFLYSLKPTGNKKTIPERTSKPRKFKKYTNEFPGNIFINFFKSSA